ncbi:MAG TPA: CAP domain-containing protein [Candidatus Limnocylindrales bacterium]
MSRLPTALARALTPFADPRRLTAMLALAFATTSVGLLAAPHPALAWDAGEYSGPSESMLISLQNQARASAGKKSLKLDADLRTIARWRSKDMIDRDYFSHTIKGTGHNVFWYMQYEYGYCFKVAGENIGTVKWRGASVEDATNWVFDAFMKSDGHRDNIMGKSWDVVAVGAYKGPDDKFMWTVLFADSCSSKPDPTPKPTPKPEPKPKPDPTHASKPDPTQKTAPRREHNDKPKPDPTKRPKPTEAPTPEPTPTAAPTLLTAPTLLVPAPSPAPTPAPTEPPDDTTPVGEVARAGTFRVVDRPPQTGLVDSILGSVVAQFFGG